MRRISIFGATGSVGQNTLDLIRRDRQSYDVIALSGGNNVEQLARDAIEFDAKIAVTAHADKLSVLREALAGSDIEVGAGTAALVEAAERPTDWTMSAITGSAGLAPGLVTLKHGNTLALANKESLVSAGRLLLQTAGVYGATILPVDSEHSAIFQALVGENPDSIENVTITASGGPFRTWSLAKMKNATLQDAMNHPNWDMGQRITIDSASMFNKALEVIETKEYFGLKPDQIKVIVHPESRVHALVGFRDGAMMAHLGPPDMRHAIGYALHWPERQHLPVERLDLAALGQLTFEAPDAKRFPALRLARDVLDLGGLAGAVFNGAKEHALDAFIDGRLRFTDMAPVVEQVLTQLSSQPGHIDAAFTLDNINEIDHLARVTAGEMIKQIRANHP